MHVGHYISGFAHAGLIGWAFLGGVFQPDPPPMEVTGVSVITSQEFEAVMKAQQAPSPETEVAVPVIPEAEVSTPDMASKPDTPVDVPVPRETDPGTPDGTPDLSQITPPAPQDVTEDAPEMPAPEPADTAVVVPETAPRPVPRPAPRVAPEPVAQPKPDTTIADDLQEATKPDESGQAAEKPKEETAPEAATTEIVTEPKEKAQASAAPSRSLRPRTRPAARPDPSKGADAAVAAALAEAANDNSAAASAPSGPPLTRGEKDGLRVSVQKCWVVDVGSRAADVTVTVGFSLDQSGKVSGDIRLISASGGDEAATRTAFQSARRAVLRCQKTGYDLPKEKYDHWRDVEITFNPEKMRRK